MVGESESDAFSVAPSEPDVMACVSRAAGFFPVPKAAGPIVCGGDGGGSSMGGRRGIGGTGGSARGVMFELVLS